jgi:hypothetical protein
LFEFDVCKTDASVARRCQSEGPDIAEVRACKWFLKGCVRTFARRRQFVSPLARFAIAAVMQKRNAPNRRILHLGSGPANLPITAM